MVEIEDKYNIVYYIFFYLSIGMLLPWNFFINVSGYWNYKLRTINATHNSTDEGNNFKFAQWFSIKDIK